MRSARMEMSAFGGIPVVRGACGNDENAQIPVIGRRLGVAQSLNFNDRGSAQGLPSALDRAQIDRCAGGEMIEDLLASPPPGMMFAHELARGLDGSLIFTVASILVEALG